MLQQSIIFSTIFDFYFSLLCLPVAIQLNDGVIDLKTGKLI